MNQRPTWAQTGDKRTWSATTGSTAMLVTRLSNGKYRASVNDARSPELATRVLAQQWAENQAGVTR
jgi:hypothetical protein